MPQVVVHENMHRQRQNLNLYFQFYAGKAVLTEIFALLEGLS